MIIYKDGKAYTRKDTIIDVDAIEREIAKIELNIANIPKEKTRPDQETLELYNAMLPRVEPLIQRKSDLELQLANIIGLMGK